jgi:hypothetical protein
MLKHFILGFCAGLLVFLAINLVSAHLASDCGLLAIFGRASPWHRPAGQVCADDIARAGWPLQFYEDGGFAYHHSFNLFFLFINIGVGMIFGAMSGSLFSRRGKPLPK